MVKTFKLYKLTLLMYSLIQYYTRKYTLYSSMYIFKSLNKQIFIWLRQTQLISNYIFALISLYKYNLVQ